MANSWRADPLEWGNGPCSFEVFLEPTCPFSVRTFGKLDDLLGQAGEDRITIRLRLQSQPWHMYSGVIVRCILAASTLEAGKAAAKSVMAAVAAHRAWSADRCRVCFGRVDPVIAHVIEPMRLGLRPIRPRRAHRNIILTGVSLEQSLEPATGSSRTRGIF